MRIPSLAVALSAALLFVAPASGGAGAEGDGLGEYVVADEDMAAIRQEWLADLFAAHAVGTWAPLKVNLSDAMLRRLGLPSRDFLLSHRFPEPTAVSADGRERRVDPTSMKVAATAGAAVAVGGTGCLGIRPGALLLIIDTTEGSITMCSMAHVYGSPGGYSISTAGHCANAGATATVVAAIGNHTPVLLDFGRFRSSTGTCSNVLLGADTCNSYPGHDWAMIGIDRPWQSLVTPTMCAWGGPRGSYTKTGALVSARFPNGAILPTIGVTPDASLAQLILHYGHGAGIGAGGTPRVGFAEQWNQRFFTFFGAVTPGDSGSGANVLEGSPIGGVNQAAGIITELYVDPFLSMGVGTMLGTRVGVIGTPASGQILPYPLPAPGLP